MRAGTRHVVNRLLAISLFGALVAGGVVAAIEAAAVLAGQGPQIDPPIEYRQWWDELSSRDLSDTQLVVVAGVLVGVGLLLVMFELWPRRRDRRTMVAETESGRAELRLSSLEPYLEDRLRTLDWVRDPDVHARVRKGSAKVDARALSRRVTASDDLAEARDVLAASIAETGLEAGRVRVRPTTDKKTLRVR